MSFTEMLEQLETLSPEQRSMLIERAMELDEPLEIPEEHRKLIEERLAAYDADPSSAIPMDEMIARVEARFKK